MKKLKMLEIYLLRFLYFFLQSVKLRRKPDNVSVKKILLVRLNHIGDLLITLPTVYSIKKYYPDARITLVTGVWNKGLAEFQKQLFDEIIYYNKKENCRSDKQIMDSSYIKEIFKKLKSDSYDLCFDFDGAWDFFRFYKSGGVKYLSSVSFLRFHQNLQQLKVLKSRYSYDIHAQHESDNIFEAAKLAGIPDMRNEFQLVITDETDKKVTDFFLRLGKGKTVGIHPIASIPEKMWISEGFAAAADFLIEKGFNVVIFGSPADKEYITGIIGAMKYGKALLSETGLLAEKCGRNNFPSELKRDDVAEAEAEAEAEDKSKGVSLKGAVLAVAADFNLGEFITGVDKCDYFISLDSLAQHVVQYFRKKAVVIYLIENSVRWSSDTENLTRLFTDTGMDSINKVIEKIENKFF